MNSKRNRRRPQPSKVAGTYAYESAPVQARKRKAAKKRQEKTMRKLVISAVLFVLMALWTWYNYMS